MSEKQPLYLMFKLAGGSPFIVTEVIGETEHELKTKFPLVFTFHDAGDNEVFVNASKFMPFAESDEVVFDKRNVYALATPKQNLLQFYINWRNDVPKDAYEKVEAMMLESAIDPTLEDSEPDSGTGVSASPTLH